MRIAIFAIPALLALGSSAAAQSAAQIEQHKSEAYGTYQCADNRVTVDAGWQVSRTWDGIHYWLQKTMPDTRLFEFGFPAHGSGLDEMYARGDNPRYYLSIYYRTGDPHMPMQEQGIWTCSKL